MSHWPDSAFSGSVYVFEGKRVGERFEISDAEVLGEMPSGYEARRKESRELAVSDIRYESL